MTYETILITLPTLTEEEEAAVLGGLTDVVRDAGGKFHITDRMGRRRLAYPIRKIEDGVYTRLLYDSNPDVPRELERRAGISDKVLRWMTVRLEGQWRTDSIEKAVRDLELRKEREAEAEAAAKAAAEAPAAEPEKTDVAPTEDAGDSGEKVEAAAEPATQEQGS